MQLIDRASEAIAPLIHTVREHADELLLVLLGFDGVLAEYEEDPAAVHLSPARRKLLRRLMSRPGVALGVVSGRRVHDLRPRVGLGDDVFSIALHGLEVVGPGFTRIEHAAFEQYPQRLRDIIAETRPLISPIRGHLESIEMVEQLLV